MGGAHPVVGAAILAEGSPSPGEERGVLGQTLSTVRTPPSAHDGEAPATLWATTVIGLCFGGGQIGLGLAATLLVALALGAMKPLDRRLPRERRALLTVVAEDPDASPEGLRSLIPLGYEASFRRQRRRPDGGLRLVYEVRWRCGGGTERPGDLLDRTAERYAVESFEMVSEVGH